MRDRSKSDRITKIASIWRSAAHFDSTLHVEDGHLPYLARKRVTPVPHSSTFLYEGMALGEVRVMTGLSLLPSRSRGRAFECVLTAIQECAASKARVRVGPDGGEANLPISELLRRWKSRRELVSVTDFHIRGTAIERVLDLSAISHFNILCQGSQAMAEQEMMTLVMSSKGAVTDSHSDDPDGSNHCFAGSKLWIVWDTIEGRANGLQDVERDYVLNRAKFNVRTFLSLKSSRWFVVSAGATLFLPGNLTHKVITLERYLGVGSFYVSLPNCVRTFHRWIELPPLWSLSKSKAKKALADVIMRSAVAHAARVRGLPKREQRRWGLSFLTTSASRWRAISPRPTQLVLLQNEAFSALIAQAQHKQ